MPCGPGLRSVGWPETPRVRLTALAPWLTGGRVATHLTAGWVWGAARAPGHTLQVSARAHRRRDAQNTEWLRIYELRYTEADTKRFGDFSVTTPLRTVLDLLYDDGFGRAERIACRLLISLMADGRAAVSTHLDTHQRPRRRLARQRLAAL